MSSNVPKHLCLVISRATGKELAEYMVEIKDWYCARHIAAAKFAKDLAARKEVCERDWYVDSIELEVA